MLGQCVCCVQASIPNVSKLLVVAVRNTRHERLQNHMFHADNTATNTAKSQTESRGPYQVGVNFARCQVVHQKCHWLALEHTRMSDRGEAFRQSKEQVP